MDIKNAIMLLEHTSYDDFNLEEHQIIGRLQAIECLVNELKKKDEVIETAIEILKIGANSYNNGSSRTSLFEAISDVKDILEDKEV